MKNYKKLTSLAAATFLMASASSSAQTVLIDISATAPITNPAGDSKYWTSIGSGTNSTITAFDLVDSSNVATTWDISITTVSTDNGGTSGTGFGGTGINGPTGDDPFDETNAITDGIFANNNSDGTALFEFSGLTANTGYDFSLIGGRETGGKDGGIKILTGTADSNAIDLDIIEADDLLDSYNLLDDGTILNFTVTSNGSGEIDFRFFKGDTTNGSNGNSTFNAMSMSVVPEPSAFALLAGMFGLTWVMLRRR